MRNVVLEGDVRDRLNETPDASVQSVVTSPPYFGLRDYGADGQIGLEDDPREYVASLVAVFREVRRVLRDDGTVWLNLGDSYAANRTYQVNGTKQTKNSQPRHGRKVPSGLKPKDLIGIPWRVAFALQDDGWYLRSDVVWSKPNPMPESILDRPTRSHEYVFLFTKSVRYFYDAEAVREPVVSSPSDLRKMREKKARLGGKTLTADDPLYKAHAGTNIGQKRGVGDPDAGRNLRSVWAITTTPFPGTHFAVFPEALPERCIRAGTSEHGSCADCGAPYKRVIEREDKGWDGSKYGERAVAATGGAKTGGTAKSTLGSNGGALVGAYRTVGWEPSCQHPEGAPLPCLVLDPFAGSGTTLRVARRLGRDFIGIELNPEYAAMARKRAFSVNVPLTRFPEQGGSL